MKKPKQPFQLLEPGSIIEWYGKIGIARSPFFSKKRTRDEIFRWVFITKKHQTENALKKMFELSKAHT